MTLTIIYFGDLVGKISRRALKIVIPEFKKTYHPDAFIANVENAAHGTGITKKIFDELLNCGVDFMTLGDHALDKEDAKALLSEHPDKIIAPANLMTTLAGTGQSVIEIKGQKILMLNFLGRVFMKLESFCPFKKADEILKAHASEELAGIIVDFHAEATSEKEAFGWHLDGRATAVVGTHTHIPTADAKILPSGTAYVTDLGMVGAQDSVIGVNKETIVRMFLEESNYPKEPVEEGACRVGAVVIQFDTTTKKATKIERIDRVIKT